MKLPFNKKNWTDVTSKVTNLQYDTWYDCFKYNLIKFLHTSFHLAHYCLSNHSYLVQYFCFLFSILNYKHLECLLYVDLWSLMQNFGEISCSLSLCLSHKEMKHDAWAFECLNFQWSEPTASLHCCGECILRNCSFQLHYCSWRFGSSVS